MKQKNAQKKEKNLCKTIKEKKQVCKSGGWYTGRKLTTKPNKSRNWEYAQISKADNKKERMWGSGKLWHII